MTGAIFIGEGHFHLKPVSVLDAADLRRRLGSDNADEDFTKVVFRFTPDARQMFLPGIKGLEEPPSEVAIAFREWKETVRRRHEIPLGYTENLFHGETMDNIDADVLAAIYIPHIRLSSTPISMARNTKIFASSCALAWVLCPNLTPRKKWLSLMMIPRAWRTASGTSPISNPSC